MAADNGQVSALCLLDLSTAFNTVDHDLLMWRLERQYGLRSVVLQSFNSYPLAELSKSSIGAVGHQPSTSHVPYHKAQCSLNVCSSCTRRTWKTTSRNMPIFKSGKRNTATNYIPVSLTSQICKVFEAIVRDQVVEFLEDNKLIRNSQHGFIKGSS